jgi:hypothetical protein
MSDQPTPTKPRRKYFQAYVPKRHQRPTACLCGGKGYRFKNGWICERCDKIEQAQGRKIEKTQKRGIREENRKYITAFVCRVEGFQ